MPSTEQLLGKSHQIHFASIINVGTKKRFNMQKDDTSENIYEDFKLLAFKTKHNKTSPTAAKTIHVHGPKSLTEKQSNTSRRHVFSFPLSDFVLVFLLSLSDQTGCTGK